MIHNQESNVSSNDFLNIEYLCEGNEKQRRVYQLISACKLFEILNDFNPVLVGTIPIQIDLPNSDIDIIVQANPDYFVKWASNKFKSKTNFRLFEKSFQHEKTVIVKFSLEEFELEIFAQNLPVTQQYAYRHLVIEDKILKAKGDAFKQEVVKLKMQGLKTEPAFAKLLGLKGDPYEALLMVQL